MVFFQAVDIDDTGFVVNYWPWKKMEEEHGSFHISFDGEDVTYLKGVSDDPGWYRAHARCGASDLLKAGEFDQLIDGGYHVWL